MNPDQLLEFYTSGGDLSTLSDADLQSLGKLMGVGAQPAPPSGLGALGAGRTEVAPSADTSALAAIPPEDLASGLLKGASLFTGVSPIPLPARTLIQAVLGGLEGAVKPGEGESRLMGAVTGAGTQAGMEFGGQKLAELLPWAGTQMAIRQGTPYSMRPGNKTREYTEAFLRQRQREGIGSGIPVGKRQASVLPKIKERTIHPTPVRTRLNRELDEVKEALPGRDIDFDAIRSNQPNDLRQPEKFLGLSDPWGTMGKVYDNDETFWEGNKLLIDSMQGNRGPFVKRTTTSGTRPIHTPGGKLLPPPANSLPGGENFSDVSYEVFSGDPTLTTFGELVEMAQKQGKEAAPVFNEISKGKWVRASDSPAQQAAKVRKTQLMKAADEHARSLGPGGEEVADKLLNTNAALTDQYKIEEIDRMIRRGLAAAGIRAGVGMGAGSSIGYLSGGELVDNAKLGAAGGLMGLGLYPANISRMGNLLGTISRGAPTTSRLFDLQDDLVGTEKKPVRRRNPR